MKILLIDWDCFGKEDIEDAFAAEGYEILRFPFSVSGDVYDDPDVKKRLSQKLRKEAPEFVFSFNYFPVISSVCKKKISGIFPGCMTVRIFVSILRR